MANTQKTGDPPIHIARISPASAVSGVSNWLRLAATPVFAIMALITGIHTGGMHDMCSAAHDGSPPAGMAAMYVLMSIFHSPPWLRLVSGPLVEMTAAKAPVHAQGEAHRSQYQSRF